MFVSYKTLSKTVEQGADFIITQVKTHRGTVVSLWVKCI